MYRKPPWSVDRSVTPAAKCSEGCDDCRVPLKVHSVLQGKGKAHQGCRFSSGPEARAKKKKKTTSPLTEPVRC